MTPFARSGLFGFGLKSVATTVNGDDLGVMEQAVEDSTSSRHVAEEFPPFFDGAIGVPFQHVVQIDVFRDAWRRLHDRRTDNASPRFRFLCDLPDSFEIILSRVSFLIHFGNLRLL